MASTTAGAVVGTMSEPLTAQRSPRAESSASDPLLVCRERLLVTVSASHYTGIMTPYVDAAR